VLFINVQILGYFATRVTKLNVKKQYSVMLSATLFHVSTCGGWVRICSQNWIWTNLFLLR